MLLNCVFVLTSLLLTTAPLLSIIKCDRVERDEQQNSALISNDDTDPEKHLNTIFADNEVTQEIPHSKEVVDSIAELTTATTTTTTTTASTTTTVSPTRISTTITSTTRTLSPQTTTEDAISIIHGCVSIKFDAKVFIMYNSNDGFEQELQLIGGNINGELSHENRCDERQHLVVNYEQITGCFLSLWLHLNATHIYVDGMRFEYPTEKLDNYPENSGGTEICSQTQPVNPNYYDFGQTPKRMCVVAQNSAKNYLMPYKLNEYIRCLDTPPVTLNSKNSNETIDVFLTNLNIRVTNNATDSGLPVNDFNNNNVNSNGSWCPIDTGNDDHTNDDSVLYYSHTQIWLGVSYAIIGAVFIFGVVFIYEKVIRKKFRYSSVRRRRHEK